MSIENSMKYFCRYHFIDVTSFGFIGDSIVEGSNCGLKRGDIAISTNMNIDISGMNQVQISKTQARKKHKYVLCY